MYWFQGQIHASQTLELPIDHPAFIYGATLFTTLRVYEHLESRLTCWQAHCDRLAQSVTAFNWAQPDWERIRDGATAIAQQFPVVRITLFPEGDELITGRSLPEDLTLRQQQGVQAWLAEPSTGGHFTRSLPNHKTGNYLAPWLALQQARSQHAQEAILINPQGHWLETSTGNLWGWAHDQWHTPSLETGILPGVLRQHLLVELHDRQQDANESIWDHRLVNQLETLVYTNSVMEVIPIQRVLARERQLIYDVHHPAIAALQRYFAKS
jgi:branched-subunit amino acid aminotransferase/4-amino-4-deoxychorismate lyase